MCGFVAWFDSEQVDPAVTLAMTRALRHRGPDDEGYLVSDPRQREALPHCQQLEAPVALALGHRRLSIQDTSEAGRQPMGYRGRYWLVYNGEVYNFPELRAELEQLGQVFRTGTDTEVILAAYDAWGAECVRRFNGMWALLLIDRERRSVFVSRDRFGIKPLFYASQPGRRLVFASEAKALLHHPELPRRPDITRCRGYLQHGTAEWESQTELVGIRRFPAACSWTVSLDRIVDAEPEPVRYWSVEPEVGHESFERARAVRHAEAYRATLLDAVRLRLRADVRVGSALSGGLDSSSIVYLVNRALGTDAAERQITFSSVYPDPQLRDCDESEHVRTMAQALDVDSHTITPHVDEAPAELHKIAYAMDTPGAGSFISAWYTYKSALRADVRVTLDGQGADEQLAGYTGFYDSYLSQLPLRELALEAPLSLRMPGARGSVLSGTLAALLRPLPLRRPQEPLNAVLLRFLTTHLQDLVRNGDRLAMGHSIESRVPFLDYRLVEQLARVPACYKVHGGWTKYLARLAFDGRLPASITWRRDKKGWPNPDRQWLSGPLRGWLGDTLSRSPLARELDLGRDLDARLGDRARVEGVVRELNLALWHAAFFEVPPAAHEGALGRDNR